MCVEDRIGDTQAAVAATQQAAEAEKEAAVAAARAEKVRLIVIRGSSLKAEITFSTVCDFSTILHSPNFLVVVVTLSLRKTHLLAPTTKIIEHRPMWSFYSMTMLYHAT